MADRCPKPWCAYPMPHRHRTTTPSIDYLAPDTSEWARLLADPTEQFDPEGIVLGSVLHQQIRDQARLTTAEREWLSDHFTFNEVIGIVQMLLYERLAAVFPYRPTAREAGDRP